MSVPQATELLDDLRVVYVELAVLDEVGVDLRLHDVALVVEGDRTADTVAGVAADEVVDLLRRGRTRVERGEEDVRRVVGLGRVQTRGGEVRRGRTGRGRQDSTLSSIGTGDLHEARVLRTVTRHERAL